MTLARVAVRLRGCSWELRCSWPAHLNRGSNPRPSSLHFLQEERD
ncbi:hypothetical protein PP304_gp199 [Gordonia phage Phendrix]|uniref:Uncharacterized protein n=2 Tax=Godonkavirus TaxID=2733178 RepID=A0A4D6E252_9CAUD|nr:hypothetical protein HOV33_gp207 [Gordonia phage GodonK]YP_010649168.1 hypothetical protein PP304_gp199 [Gordonia phage Phendrix]QBZ72749.1 hypothetical protein SEA_GODONK_143 [Gordonia phage GodonK]QDK02671.1 hypothetical protein SEA_PHENDRIX_137 [Gordonia phage Phendrix]